MSKIENAICMLLDYGWANRTIAKYLMIKESLVKYYRKKYNIVKDEYQGFY